jgi:hypothetical protein
MVFDSGSQIQNYGELLPANFHVSRNFREVVEGDTHPLSPYRKEPTYFVLHINGNGDHEFCVVSNKEFETHRKGKIGDNTFLFIPDTPAEEALCFVRKRQRNHQQQNQKLFQQKRLLQIFQQRNL